jgi:hypothetical protein
MVARADALERISKTDVSNGHVGRSVRGHSQDDRLKGQQLKRCLRRSGKNDPPYVRPSHENRQRERSCFANEVLLPASPHAWPGR